MRGSRGIMNVAWLLGFICSEAKWGCEEVIRSVGKFDVGCILGISYTVGVRIKFSWRGMQKILGCGPFSVVLLGITKYTGISVYGAV